ncbi:unnamed protein product [Caenorhabditis angaria]|uniref:Uncharacterized protein n=1 Tax=Caenorhabditis angaria TaxID=860376 RepID=A0A9P1N1R0_9PELO|nr:unnamed protein product [Caenorhabditis angaria]
MLTREDIEKAEAREKRMRDALSKVFEINIKIPDVFTIEKRIAKNKLYILAELAKTEKFCPGRCSNKNACIDSLAKPSCYVIETESPKKVEKQNKKICSTSRNIEETCDLEKEAMSVLLMFHEESTSPIFEGFSNFRIPGTYNNSRPEVSFDFIDWKNTPCCSTDPLFIEKEIDPFHDFLTPAANSPETPDDCREQKIIPCPIKTIKAIDLKVCNDFDMDILLEEEFQQMMEMIKEQKKEEEERRKAENDALMKEITELLKESRKLEMILKKKKIAIRPIEKIKSFDLRVSADFDMDVLLEEEFQQMVEMNEKQKKEQKRRREDDELMDDITDLARIAMEPETEPRNQGFMKRRTIAAEKPNEPRISFALKSKENTMSGPTAKKRKFCPRIREFDASSDDELSDVNPKSLGDRGKSNQSAENRTTILQNVSKLIEEFEQAKFLEKLMKSIEELEKKYEWPFEKSKGVYWPVTVPSIDQKKRKAYIERKHMEQLMKNHSCSGSYLADFLLVNEDSSKTAAEQFLQNYAVSGSKTWNDRRDRSGRSEWKRYDELEGGRFAHRKSYKTNSTNQTKQMAYATYDENRERERNQTREYWEMRGDELQRKDTEIGFMKDCVRSHRIDCYSPQSGSTRLENYPRNYKWTVDLNQLQPHYRDEQLQKTLSYLNKAYDEFLKIRHIDWRKWYGMPMHASLYFQWNLSNLSVSQYEAVWEVRKQRVEKLLSKRLSLNMQELRKLCKLTEADKKVWTILYENLSAHFNDFPMLSQILDNPDRIQVLNKVFKKKFP